MKTYILILFIAVHCSLFSMKRGPKDTSNFFDFTLSPSEIQENIIYIFLSEDNPLFRSVIIRLVCKKWAHIVMNKKGRINDLLKIAESRNSQYLFSFLAASEEMAKMTNVTYVKAASFNVRYKRPTSSGREYIMSYIIKERNEDLFLNAIKREHACLNKESILILVHQAEHSCILDNNGMCSESKNFNKNLNFLLKNKPAIFLKCKYDFFEELINSSFANFCIFKMIVPYLEVHNSGNISYYLKVMIEREKNFLENNKAVIPSFMKIIPSTNSQDCCKARALVIDERHYYYLSLLIKEGANILVPIRSLDGEMVPLAATLIKEVDGNFFPKVKQLLENSIKVQRYLDNITHTKKAID